MGHLRLAEVRPIGSATVAAHHLPDGRAVIRLVTDDMPYLVDSVTAEVIRQGFALAHIVHPVVVVRRDLRGRILAFCDSRVADGCGADALTESWMAVVLDGPLDDEASTDLVPACGPCWTTSGRSTRTPTGCTPGCSSWPTGSTSWPRRHRPYADPADDPAEAAALLRWLADGNFVFLGARDVDQGPVAGSRLPPCSPAPGSGVLRSDTDMTATVAARGRPDAGPSPAHVTKADTRSPCTGGRGST